MNTVCSRCGALLTGRRDTFGTYARPVCAACYYALTDTERYLRSLMDTDELGQFRVRIEAMKSLTRLERWRNGEIV